MSSTVGSRISAVLSRTFSRPASTTGEEDGISRRDGAVEPDGLSNVLPLKLFRRHPASLIPRYMHDPLMLGLLASAVDEDLIEHLAECTLAVVSASSAPKDAFLPTPPTTPTKPNSSPSSDAAVAATPDALPPMPTPIKGLEASMASLTTFIRRLVSRSHTRTPTLLVALVYLDRLRQRLVAAKAARGMGCTYHRLFLACLIAAAKFTHDCTPKNKHWTAWSGVFSLEEVNMMEHELLHLLEHNLNIDDADFHDVCSAFLPTPSSSPDLPSPSSSASNSPRGPASHSLHAFPRSPSPVYIPSRRSPGTNPPPRRRRVLPAPPPPPPASVSMRRGVPSDSSTGDSTSRSSSTTGTSGGSSVASSSTGWTSDSSRSRGGLATPEQSPCFEKASPGT